MIKLSWVKRLNTKKWLSWAKPKALNLESIELSWAILAQVWADQPYLIWADKFGTLPLIMGGGQSKEPELAINLIGQLLVGKFNLLFGPKVPCSQSPMFQKFHSPKFFKKFYAPKIPCSKSLTLSTYLTPKVSYSQLTLLPNSNAPKVLCPLITK